MRDISPEYPDALRANTKLHELMISVASPGINPMSETNTRITLEQMRDQLRAIGAYLDKVEKRFHKEALNTRKAPHRGAIKSSEQCHMWLRSIWHELSPTT